MTGGGGGGGAGLRADGLSIILHGLHDRLRHLLPVCGHRDGSRVDHVRLKAAFDEHARDRDVADDHETRALDPAIPHARPHHHRGVHGRGERHVFRVVLMAGARREVGDRRPVRGHRRHAARGERVRFEASPSAARIEMHRNEKRVLLRVRDLHAVVERDECVVRAREHDFVSVLRQQQPRTRDDIQCESLFVSVRRNRTAIVSAVSGIEHDGVDLLRVLDFSGAHHWLDQLRQIHARHAEVAIALDHRVAEDELQIVDEEFLRVRAPAQRTHPAFELKLARSHLNLPERVELRDVLDADVIATPDLVERPVTLLRTGRFGSGSGGEKERCQQEKNPAHGRRK